MAKRKTAKRKYPKKAPRVSKRRSPPKTAKKKPAVTKQMLRLYVQAWTEKHGNSKQTEEE